MNRPSTTAGAMRSFKLDEFVAHNGTVNCLRIGRNTAGVLATGGEDKKVNLWRIGQPHVAKSLVGLQSPVECVTFDASEDHVAAGAANGTVKVWDIETGRVCCSLVGHRSNCLTIDFNPDPSCMAVTGSLDTNIKVWDLRTKDAITTYKGHSSGVRKLAISPDGKWVCSGSESGELKLWDMTAGRTIKDSWSHNNCITGIEFHPCEFLLATSSTDRTVRVWDLDQWEHVETLGPEATAVRAIAYPKDGRQLLAATSDALKVWGCEPAVHHDTVQMDWRNLADMHLAYKDGQPRVIGCCCSNSAVGVFLVDLRKVAPFQEAGTTAAGGVEQAVAHSGSGRSSAQQQRNGIGRHSLQPQLHHQPATHVESPVVPGSSPYNSYSAGSQAAAPVGPLTQQLSRQRTPQGMPMSSCAVDTPSSTEAAEQTHESEYLLGLLLQPGQLLPADSIGQQQHQHQQQQQHRQARDTFPALEIIVPAGPSPPSSAVDSGGPYRNSSRDYGSSRQTSGYDAEAAAAGMRGLSFPDAAPGSYSGASNLPPPPQQQQRQRQQQQPYNGISSYSGAAQQQQQRQPYNGVASYSSTASRASSAGGISARSANSRVREWLPQACAALATVKSSSAPGDMPAGGGTAPAPDPILAAMAQRPLLKSDLVRMVTALQLAKGFLARGNFEGAYKAVLNQGDTAVACMLVEALQSRQDAFELNSVEPLIKLLELLLATGQEQQQGVALSALALVLHGPGQVVREVCGGPGPVGVDLSYEQRKNKCLLVKMGLEGLGMKLGMLARGSGPLAARTQLLVEELKRVVG
ncbi:WD40-repeat-containing domain protein [Scenedesmus sp. NREL 46B-D3]|nr:WD40-repeat-containing domain protein [Scenedesmus sp. NREL 46B-D3]